MLKKALIRQRDQINSFFKKLVHFCGLTYFFVVNYMLVMKKLALDVGTVRIGLASCDILGLIASAYGVYKRKTLKMDAVYIANLAKELNVDEIIMGKPLKLDGSAGQSVKMVEDLAEAIGKETNIPIVFQDERLSTVSAQRMLIEGNVRREKRKDLIDAVSATIILQNYLDKPKHN